MSLRTLTEISIQGPLGTVSDGSRSKKGYVPQWKEVPIAKEKYLGKVIQYLGASDGEFTHNYFYECISEEPEDGTIVYEWIRVGVQPEGGLEPQNPDYMTHVNKPAINGTVLEGNLTHDQLGLAGAEEVAQGIEDIYQFIDDSVNDCVVDVSKKSGETLGLTVAYGDDVTEDIDLDHLHSQYLTQHQDLSEYAKTQEVAIYLEDKAQKNLSNVTGSYDWVVVDNKTSNYRVWRNKKLECRGIATSVASSDGVTISLPMAYENQNYIIHIDVREIGNWFISCAPIGNQQFKVRISDSYGTPKAVSFSWTTEGYII